MWVLSYCQLLQWYCCNSNFPWPCHKSVQKSLSITGKTEQNLIFSIKWQISSNSKEPTFPAKHYISSTFVQKNRKILSTKTWTSMIHSYSYDFPYPILCLSHITRICVGTIGLMFAWSFYLILKVEIDGYLVISAKYNKSVQRKWLQQLPNQCKMMWTFTSPKTQGSMGKGNPLPHQR